MRCRHISLWVRTAKAHPLIVSSSLTKVLTIWVDLDDLVVSLLNGFEHGIEDVARVSLSSVVVFIFHVDNMQIALMINRHSFGQMNSLEFRLVATAVRPENLMFVFVLFL